MITHTSVNKVHTVGLPLTVQYVQYSGPAPSINITSLTGVPFLLRLPSDRYHPSQHAPPLISSALTEVSPTPSLFVPSALFPSLSSRTSPYHRDDPRPSRCRPKLASEATQRV